MSQQESLPDSVLSSSVRLTPPLLVSQISFAEALEQLQQMYLHAVALPYLEQTYYRSFPDTRHVSFALERESSSGDDVVLHWRGNAIHRAENLGVMTNRRVEIQVSTLIEVRDREVVHVTADWQSGSLGGVLASPKPAEDGSVLGDV